MATRGDARPAGGGATPRRRPSLAHSGLKMAAAVTEPMNPPAKKYGSVVITLENVLLPPEKLSPSPSQQDGLDADIEMDLRILGCELIQTGGILLRLPQVSLGPGFPRGCEGNCRDRGGSGTVVCVAGRGWGTVASTRDKAASVRLGLGPTRALGAEGPRPASGCVRGRGEGVCRGQHCYIRGTHTAKRAAAGAHLAWP